MSSKIAAIATHLPARVVTNDDLAAVHPDWNMASVAERAGVRSRHIAAADETAFDLVEGRVRQAAGRDGGGASTRSSSARSRRTTSCRRTRICCMTISS